MTFERIHSKYVIRINLYLERKLNLLHGTINNLDY